nr:relaxase/mobilization nuclease domain-containing protein [Psychrobacter sp. Marseille-P5312]
MIVKFFTHGTGGSKGVFDYLLKDKDQEDGLRRDAEVLRGDIDNQALLIDSLDFKQKYTSGCLSFTESADQVTEEQKNALMDGFEQTIRAGLDVDRVAVSWIEHRDKGRLELNFVFANVDLEHGRAFQPYIHNVDKRRVNAWKDIQNIEHGFTDPNDPAKKRLMAQRDNLPRDIKEARQAITDGLTELVEEGVITSRDDVIQALTDGGFEIARETDKAISIKNPDPTAKRNIRLTGRLYERDFNFSAEVQSTVTAASKDYRARSTERYDAAKQLYDSEIARKRDYHQSRHDKPRREQRAVTADVRQASTRFSYSPYNLFEQRPSPFNPRFKPTRKRESDNDSELRTAHYTADRAKRERNSASHQVKNRQVGNNRRDSVISDIRARGAIGNKNEQAHDLQVLSRQQERSNVYATAKGLKDGQTAIRPSTASAASTAGHDQTSSADARRQRPRYSRIDSIIDQASTSANTASKGLAELARAVTEQDKRTSERTERLAQSSKDLHELDKTASRRVSKAVQHSNSASREHERVSECNSATRELKRQYGAVKGQIEQFAENAERTRDLTNKNNKLADRNRDGTAGIRQVAEQIREVIKTQENQRQRYSAPRMGR